MYKSVNDFEGFTFIEKMDVQDSIDENIQTKQKR